MPFCPPRAAARRGEEAMDALEERSRLEPVSIKRVLS